MYQWVRPRVAIPVHGEARHLAAHAEIAKQCQVPQQIVGRNGAVIRRSEEHTSELQSLMRISYAVFCLKKKNKKRYITPNDKTYIKVMITIVKYPYRHQH